MQELIDAYRSHHGVKRAVTVEQAALSPGQAAYADGKACDECMARGKAECRDENLRQTLIVKSSVPYVAARAEGAFNQFDGLTCEFRGGKCDLAFLWEDGIAFVEMTCSQGRYIEPFHGKPGKRSKARSQLESVIRRLCEVPEIAARMEAAGSRRGVFAYRSKQPEIAPEVHAPIEAEALRGMTAFSSLQPQRNPLLWADLGYGFKFYEVEYPGELLIP